jgi:Lar family restriction alleviation protein
VKLTLELLPCPFCGDDADFERIGTPKMSTIVACTGCGARHESADEGEHAGSSWNHRATRPDPAPLPVDVLVSARHETIHADAGPSRPARVARDPAPLVLTASEREALEYVRRWVNDLVSIGWTQRTDALTAIDKMLNVPRSLSGAGAATECHDPSHQTCDPTPERRVAPGAHSYRCPALPRPEQGYPTGYGACECAPTEPGGPPVKEG